MPQGEGPECSEDRFLMFLSVPFLAFAFGFWDPSPRPRWRWTARCRAFDEVGDRVTEAPTCDAAMQLLMACQMGSSADVAVSLIVIEKCEGDFLSSLDHRARRGYERKVGACGKNFSGEGGTLFQSIRAICAAQVAHDYAGTAGKAKK